MFQGTESLALITFLDELGSFSHHVRPEITGCQSLVSETAASGMVAADSLVNFLHKPFRLLWADASQHWAQRRPPIQLVFDHRVLDSLQPDRSCLAGVCW
ncbi:hypothetical protein TorRG33x02_008330 [Trema orientale]|uniref:Uncharacterized protein n=1 Tax=Trema orientale TaxID=63057 RepID=A0A2P5G0P1_TREOI|nr:hypothetical protein TorRG33x02_008330 [Trema orientale]